MDDIRQKMYDMLVEKYGDEFKWFKIKITMFKNKPINEGITMVIDTDTQEIKNK